MNLSGNAIGLHLKVLVNRNHYEETCQVGGPEELTRSIVLFTAQIKTNYLFSNVEDIIDLLPFRIILSSASVRLSYFFGKRYSRDAYASDSVVPVAVLLPHLS